MPTGTPDSPAVDAIPEPRPLDELELGCILCRKEVGAQELVVIWPRHNAVAHVRCACDQTTRLAVGYRIHHLASRSSS